MRRLLARARQSLHQQQERSGTWDLELSCASLDGLLEGGVSAVVAAFDAPEVLPLQCATAPPQQVHSSAAAPTDWATSKQAWVLQQPWLPTLNAAADAPLAVPRQLPACGAHAQPAALAAEAEEGWAFEDPATVATYQQLRQRQAAATRRRELQQQMKDPVQRLQRFHGTIGVPRGSGSLSSTGSSSMSSSSRDWSLPALPSPRAALAMQISGQRQAAPSSDASSRSGGGGNGGSPAAAVGRRGGRPTSMPALRPRIVHLDG